MGWKCFILTFNCSICHRVHKICIIDMPLKFPLFFSLSLPCMSFSLLRFIDKGKQVYHPSTCLFICLCLCIQLWQHSCTVSCDTNIHSSLELVEWIKWAEEEGRSWERSDSLFRTCLDYQCDHRTHVNKPTRPLLPRHNVTPFKNFLFTPHT